MNWAHIVRACKTNPDLLWELTFKNGERIRGTISHVPAGEPGGWAPDAVVHVRPGGQGPKIGEPHLIDKVVGCIEVDG